MNYVNDVLKMLGVEVGERFKLKHSKGDFIDGLFEINDSLTVFKQVGVAWFKSDEAQFNDILVGDFEIVKLPFKPRYGDKYYYYSDADWNDTVICEEWFNDATDLAMWKVGNVFKTKEEALEKGKEIFEKLKKEYGDC